MIRAFLRRGESAQATIFVAVLVSALMGIVGMTIEGGRTLVEYRSLQAAADMSALVGAQNLPCGTTGTAGATCVSNAEKLACTYAGNNSSNLTGYGGCTAGGSSGASANVPPRSCSPYDFIDYGNGSGNSNCKATTTPSFYSYIETSLSDNLGTIPIFNIPVTLSAHAIAKKGPQIGGDYAIVALDPSTPLTLDIGGNATVKVTGSVFANGGISGNSKNDTTCQGGWYSSGPVSGVLSNTSGTPVFAPAGCTGSTDGTPLSEPSQPQIQDPYSGSVAPPTQPQGSAFVNCPECSQPGYWYSFDTRTWNQGGNPTGNIELFPGIYGQINKNSGDMYFNPGVYTLTAGMDFNHGTICVYGSPSCTNNNCATNTFNPGDAAGDQWYYSCSPYGFWDSNPPSGAPSALSTVPTFYDESTGSASSVPLNGVTFYMPPGSGGILTAHGNTGSSGGVYPAAPNPCAGTGSYSSAPIGAASFTAGSPTGVFTYNSTYTSGNHGLPNGITQSVAGQLYPSEDFTLAGECAASTTLEVWPGEFTKPQHLHFLFYTTDTSSMLLNGASGQQYTGIMYAPNSTLTVNGAGKAGGGPPWINGQLIAFDIGFSGNSYNDITYRPCAPGSTACGSGSGTQLIQ